eukprot:GEMP01059465.1.p1 GENE.GEMP01059465.1~~GEMP01059465.1.p1  ORF type:complete len:224 (+),score=42.52 GEMP01059465.1:67-738(+)
MPIEFWQKMIVAVDVDEVLCNFLKGFLEFFNDKYGATLKFSDFKTLVFAAVTGQSAEESRKTVKEFVKSRYFESLELVSGSQEALKELKAHGVQFQVVTSRAQALEQITNDWVSEYYPEIFSDVHVLNHFGNQGTPGPQKFEICAEIHAPILIDDSLANCMGMAKSGKSALLFDLDGTYGWNEAESLPDSIKRVHSWSEVVTEIKKLISPSGGSDSVRECTSA